MESLAAYLASDRLVSLTSGGELSENPSGAVLFADISGFTPLTEAFVDNYGAKRGAELIVDHLNKVYGVLIEEAYRFEGSVISFSGDAITCWFENDHGPRAIATALNMQNRMSSLPVIALSSSQSIILTIKIGVAVGSVHRLSAGNPTIQQFDLLAGNTLERMALAEHTAHPGEIVVGEVDLQALGNTLQTTQVHRDEVPLPFYVVTGLKDTPLEQKMREITLPPELENQARPWVLPPVFDRLTHGVGHFSVEIQTTAALFCQFGPIDFDNDTDAHRKLDAFVNSAQEVLTRFEGYILQLTHGDKGTFLYGAFGAPIAHDDDMTRALAAALELRSLPSRLGFINEIRIGISSGRTRAGAYGSPTRCTYGVLGDEVNTAARLMQMAEPDQILVSERVKEETVYLFDFRTAGTFPIKGKSEMLSAYRLIGVKQVPIAQRSHEYFVGRDRDLDHLKSMLKDAAERRHAVGISGPAGIGKSCLTEEWASGAYDSGWRVITGTGYSTTWGLAYYPWRQIFRSLLNIPDEVTDQDALTANLQHHSLFIEHIDLNWRMRLPLLGDLLGVPVADNAITASYDPLARQTAIAILAVELIHACAIKRPHLLVIDNAHWIDTASQQLMMRILQYSDRLSVVAPVLFRDDPSLAAMLSEGIGCDLVRLKGLSDSDISAIVRYRLDGDVSSLVLAVLHNRAGGNPWFARRLCDHLKAQGLIRFTDGTRWVESDRLIDLLQQAGKLQREDGEWRLAKGATLPTVELGVPNDLQSLIRARIAQLPEWQQHTLKVACVIGQDFDLQLLAQVHPAQTAAAGLLEQIEAMIERGILARKITSTDEAFAFTDNLTPEALYDTLTEAQRREVHGRIGAALESHRPDDIEQLAYHYSRSGIRAKQLLYLGKAARKAQRQSLYDLALSYYVQVLDVELRWEWLKGKVEVLHILGRRNEELSALQEINRLSTIPPVEAAVLWSEYYESIGELVPARERVEYALTLCRSESDRSGEMQCLSRLGSIASRQGEFDQSAAYYGAVIGTLKEVADQSDENMLTLIRAYNGQGVALGQQSQFEASHTALEEATRLSEQHNFRREKAQVLNHLGLLAFSQGNSKSAVNHHQLALNIRREIGDRAGEGASYYNLGITYLEAGDYSKAHDHLLKAEPIHHMSGNRWYEIKISNALGVYCLMTGDAVQAREFLRQSRLLAQKIGDRAAEADALCNLGLCYSGVFVPSSDLVEAEQALHSGLAIAQEKGDLGLSAMCWSYLGLANLQADRPVEAIQNAIQALHVRHDLKLHNMTSIDYATLAKAHLIDNNPTQARENTQHALQILEAHRQGGPEFPQRDYYVCYQVLTSLGDDPYLALDALKKAFSSVSDKADNITDPNVRQSFLEKVLINRQIVDTYNSSPLATKRRSAY